MQITTSKIRFNFKTLIFLYITRNRNYKVSQFTFRVMRNHLFNYIILCILVPSILFSSPVEDFLNPEKKRKITTSSQDTIPKKNPQEKKHLDSPTISKISDKNSKITNQSEQISKDISKSKKKKYEDAIPTVKDDTPATPSYTIQSASESVSGAGFQFFVIIISRLKAALWAVIIYIQIF